MATVAQRVEPTEDPGQIPERKLVAYIGTYPPQECGIATFTLDVVNATDISGWGSVVAAISGDCTSDEEQDSKQVYTIERDNSDDYARAAKFLSDLGADLLCIEHEYGIFGGDHGEYVTRIAETSRVPVIVTLHTVLPNPSGPQKRIIQDLAKYVSRFVVMAEKAKQLLPDVYGVPVEKICTIPHGAPDVFLESESAVKESFGLSGKKVLSTFGLIAPSKGIEDAIAALPAVVEKEPNTIYLVLGATHPTVKRREGEAYRRSLEAQVNELGLQDHVRFVNKFLTVQELIDYLLATDIYITPYYTNPHQITSGTLAYAMATGRVIVSTPYLYAEELLSNGRGFLYPFRDTAALSATLSRLLTDKELFDKTKRVAYGFGRNMTWPCVGLQYVHLYRDVLKEHGVDPGPEPEAYVTAGYRSIVRQMMSES